MVFYTRLVITALPGMQNSSLSAGQVGKATLIRLNDGGITDS